MPVLACAAGRVYRNDDIPLSAKLPDASQLMLRQLNILDLFAAIGLGVMALISGSVLAAGMAVANRLAGKRRKESGGLYPRYARAAKQAVDMTRIVPTATQHWDERLGQLAYETVKASHIHLLWPRELQKKNDIVANGLWHVCPAHVYEARVVRSRATPGRGQF